MIWYDAVIEDFDTAELFVEREDQLALLEEAFASGDPAFVAHALGLVARARGMTETAREAVLGRQALYKALSKEGNPRLDTLFGVLAALDLKLAPGWTKEACVSDNRGRSSPRRG